jgi:hypothetical protein
MNHPYVTILTETDHGVIACAINFNTEELIPLADLTKGIWNSPENMIKHTQTFAEFYNNGIHSFRHTDEVLLKEKQNIIEVGRKEFKKHRTINAQLNPDFEYVPVTKVSIRTVISSSTLEEGIALTKTLWATNQI